MGMTVEEYLASISTDPSLDLPSGFRSGFVALCGRPNAGKSSLANALVGEKVAITSGTAQTTRKRIQAVADRDMCQLVLLDTPGLHKPVDVLGEQLDVTALSAMSDADVVAMVLDSSKPFGRGDEWVAEHVKKSGLPRICVLSKCDLVDSNTIQQQVAAACSVCEWDAIVSLSAKTGYNLDAFVEEAAALCPEGPRWFPKGMSSDQSDQELISEFIREKVLRSYTDEVPHSCAVSLDHFEYVPKKALYRIIATIYVERESQKGILIGKGGKAIKKVGINAREDLERLLGAKVFLELSVKVKKGWRSDEAQLRRFGYME